MKTKNTYKILFKDGTHFDSSGSAEQYNGQKSTIESEFKWTSAHIEKEVAGQGKTLADVAGVEYSLSYDDSASRVYGDLVSIRKNGG